MPEWDDIFAEKGKVFEIPHPEMEKLSSLFIERGVIKILDLGCGTGRHLIFFSKKGFKVYGVDASPTALKMAKDWVKNEGLNVETFLHRMENPFPFENDFFDAIISIQVIHHNLKKQVIFTIQEITRVLKKNGFIFITVPYLGSGSKLEGWNLKEIEPGTYVPHAGQEAGLPHHFFTEDELIECFDHYEIIKVYIDTTKHRALLARKK
jgi:SAM-dependent methyltransferase